MSQKNQTSSALTPQSEAEAIVVQHALAFYRDMKRNAQNAPIGEFINYAEAIAIAKGRELIATSLQTLTQEEVNNTEKKAKRDSAEPAARRNGIWAGKQKRSKPLSEP